MKLQTLLGFIFCTLVFNSMLFANPLRLDVNAESAILMNADNGMILFEKEPHVLQFPASITKVATLSYALSTHEVELDTVVTAEQEAIASVTETAIRRSNYTLPAYWIEQGSSHIGIKKGEELTFRALLYGMMLPSANDAANVVAQFAGKGSISKFIDGLNGYVKNLGCTKSHFCNPHGLHHPKHQTTAYEMALITREGLKNPTFREISSTVRYTRPKTNMQNPTTLVQLNKLLRTGRFYYPKAIGIKTGYTSLALNTFVAAATHEGRTLIAVLLKTKERNDIFTDAAKMFDAAFNELKVKKVLLKVGLQKFALNLEGATQPIPAFLKKSLTLEYFPAEEPKIKCLLNWDKLTPPIMKGQKIGEVNLVDARGTIYKTLPLYAAEEVRATWFYWLKNIF